MIRARIGFLIVLIAGALPGAVRGQPICGPDRITARSVADTIFVQHAQATRNCCTDLQLQVHTVAFVANFYEAETGTSCHCTCCFVLRYEAHGFAAGRYLVRVWDEQGTVLYGETEVDVSGVGTAPTVGWADRGDCQGEPIRSATWAMIRGLYE